MYALVMRKSYQPYSVPPFGLLLALFVSVPLVEIYFLIKVGSFIGATSTILLVLLTAMLGAFLVRVQGLSTLAKVQTSLSRGEIPATELIEGLILLLTGVLLLTPGFFTDALGFLCLVPRIRHRIARSALQRIAPPTYRAPGERKTLDAEFWRDD